MTRYITWSVALLAVTACGSGTSSRPDSSGDVFERGVIDVLERRCGTCHALTHDDYVAFQRDEQNQKLLRWEVDDGGNIATDAQREIARDKLSPWIDLEAPALASDLVTAPLSPTFAGPGFAHPEVFTTPEDADFATVRDWVEGMVAAGGKQQQPLSTAEELFFANELVPMLERKQCMTSACHGPLSFSDLKYRTGIPLLPDRFTPAMHRHNRTVMLGARKGQTRLVHLAGDVRQSRQVLKNIPMTSGGILHKGGNEFFEPGDPDYELMVEWLELEAAAERKRLGADLGAVDGIIFVRRPRATPERYFEDEAFLSGADLMWQRGDELVNLTETLRGGSPADIRRPAVSFDATRVAFAMRRGAGEGFDIWEIDLATRDARQLTFSEGPNEHYLDPLYVPDPDDAKVAHLDQVAIAFVTNRDGEVAATSPDGILGEAEGGTRTSIIDDERTERAGAFANVSIRFVRGTNAGEVRTIRNYAPGTITLDRALPFPVDSTTHYVIEVPQRFGPSYQLYRMRLAAAGAERATFRDTLVRMTYALGQIRRPHMRSTGEVMMTSLRDGWQSDRPFFNGAIFRVHDNGSDFHTHYGNRSVVPIIASNREMPHGLEIRIGRDADSYWGGALLIADHQFGPPLDPRNPVDDQDHPFANGQPDHGMHSHFRGWVSLDDDVAVGGVSAGGAYRDPHPMPDGSILVSFAPGPVDLSDPNAAPNFDIVRVWPDPSLQSADGLGGGGIRHEPAIGGPDAELWPTPVAVQPKPPFHKPQKWHGHSGDPTTIRGFAGYPDDVPSLVVVFDLVLLDAFFTQSVPAGERHLRDEVCTVHGHEMPRDQQLAYARIVGALPNTDGQTGPPARYVIAEVPLEDDGSFQTLLPTHVAFDIQGLNADRMALASPNRWLYTHPGEKHSLSIPRTLYSQTCSGCHGQLSGEGPLPFGRPDVVTSASRTLAMWDADTLEVRRPRDYSKPGAGTGIGFVSVGFDEDIAPIVAAKCTECHAAGGAAPRLDDDSSFDALREVVDHREGLAYESYLIEMLYGRELGAARTLPVSEPHPKADALLDSELTTFVRWIDVGAPRTRAKQ
jgi:hypothetical protein